jgi:hypothetical protein
MGRPSKTKEDYISLASDRGFKWKGNIENIQDVFSKTEWQCNNLHVWQATYVGVKRGDGCPYCKNTKLAKSLNDYIKLGESKGFNYVGNYVPNTKTKTYWQCKCGNILKLKYNDLCTRNICCDNCYFMSIRNTVLKTGITKKDENDYYKIAQKHNLEWLGSKVENVHTKTLWKCSFGHIWETTYSLIKKGRGCPFCSNLNQKNSKDYIEMGELLGLQWVDVTIPKYVRNLTSWKCSKGHLFKSSYNNLQKTKGCPLCKNFVNGVLVSKPQMEISSLLNGSLNVKVKNIFVDIFVEYLGFSWAIEYDGKFWHQIKNLKRDAILQSQGLKVLHIESRNKIPSKEYLQNIMNNMIKNNIDIEYHDLDIK